MSHNQCLDDMGFLQVKFFMFLLFSAVYPKISSQTVTCGDNNFYIQYPFQLLQEGQNPHHRGHYVDQFILKCNNQGLVVLNLPFSGEFYVRDIDYFEQKIQLYDPGNCLPGRLKNLSLPSSPFQAVTYQNYTFFSCPPESLMSSHNFSVISCLSNSTASILATSLLSIKDEIVNLTGCKVIYNLQIPVSQPFQFEYNGFNGDLQLAWNVPSCKGDCKGRSRSKLSVLSIFITCFITISIAILGTLLCIGCCLSFAVMMSEIDEANNQRSHSSYTTRVWEMARITILPPAWLRPQPPAPSVATAPLDEFSFTSSTKVPNMDAASNDEASTVVELIIGGSQCIPEPIADSCSICLKQYEASERLTLICNSKHCFHANCLEKWLQTGNTTCPLCRIAVH